MSALEHKMKKSLPTSSCGYHMVQRIQGDLFFPCVCQHNCYNLVLYSWQGTSLTHPICLLCRRPTSYCNFFYRYEFHKIVFNLCSALVCYSQDDRQLLNQSNILRAVQNDRGYLILQYFIHYFSFNMFDYYLKKFILNIFTEVEVSSNCHVHMLVQVLYQGWVESCN